MTGSGSGLIYAKKSGRRAYTIPLLDVFRVTLSDDNSKARNLFLFLIRVERLRDLIQRVALLLSLEHRALRHFETSVMTS